MEKSSWCKKFRQLFRNTSSPETNSHSIKHWCIYFCKRSCSIYHTK